MLTPETLKALDQALTAVIDEAGHDPQYAPLVHALTAAKAELPAEHDAPVHDQSDPHGFGAAKAQMIASRKGAPA